MLPAVEAWNLNRWILPGMSKLQYILMDKMFYSHYSYFNILILCLFFIYFLIEG